MELHSLNMFNDLIYQIYNEKDFKKMLEDVSFGIKAIIPNVCCTIYQTDGNIDSKSIKDIVCVPKEYSNIAKGLPIKHNKEFSHWLIRKNQSTVVKSSTFMTESERSKSMLYKVLYEPFGFYYSMDLSIAEHGEFLGILSIYRTLEDGDFNDTDMLFLKLLGEHLNSRFYIEKYGYESDDTISKNVNSHISYYGFTAREAEILELILIGLSNEEICDKLVISHHTLKKHLQNLYRKTNITSRTQLKSLF